ncbi:hypothetical protein G7046_g1234 [Stylonectria norvegica]|nr:hypothetical protein G7046_g1234 [Stylonectria norvegica]
MSSNKGLKAITGCWTCKGKSSAIEPYPDVRTVLEFVGSAKGTVARRTVDHVKFINTTWWDVAMYHHYLSQPNSPRAPYYVRQPLWSRPQRQPQLTSKRIDLVEYFHEAAHRVLISFYPNSTPIRDVLMRLAISYDTVPGGALYYALLAVSSLHRSGLQVEAVQFKVAALQALSASARDCPLDPIEAAQHVATCMLLCTFEIQLPSESSGEWLWYIQGALEIVRGTRLDQLPDQPDIGVLVDWVSYHDAVSRFTMRHWQHKSVVKEPTNSSKIEASGIKDLPIEKARTVPHSPRSAHAILDLLSETCSTLLDPLDPASQDEEYKARMAQLEMQVRTLPDGSSTPETWASPDNNLLLSIELYQVSTLIYLIRASGGPTSKLKALVERAFAAPVQYHSCHHFFPLFVLGCEAKTEEQRSLILALIERTERDSLMRSMKGVRDGIEGIWVQQDLHADEDLVINYDTMLSGVISANSTLPSYA